MQIGLGIGTTFRQKWVPSLTEQIRSLLFSASEQGAWYDPSDMSTLFQDSAGTVPVTAVEQPVGRMLDKSGRGNHASQATTTKRPVLSRRVNLLTQTEALAGDQYVKNNCIAINDGGQIYSGAVKIASNSANAVTSLVTGLLTGYQVVSAKFKADGVRYLCMTPNTYAVFSTTFDLVAGVVTQNSTSYAGSSSSIENLGDGWYRCTWDMGAPIVSARVRFALSSDPTGNHTGTTFQGDGVSGVLMAHPSLTRKADAHLPYQRVNTETDYDADPAKFPAYLHFDGVDDALSTGNIYFTSTDKMTVWAGVTKLSDTARGCIVELGNGSVDISSIMYLNGPGISGGSTKFSFAAVGPVSTAYVAGTAAAVLAAPSTAVMCGLYVPGTSSKLRVNGVRTSADSINPPGNFYIRPLYIGARAGASLFFNGRLYSLIVRGAESSLSQIEATEFYIKQKMRLP